MPASSATEAARLILSVGAKETKPNQESCREEAQLTFDALFREGGEEILYWLQRLFTTTLCLRSSDASCPG